MCIRLFGVVFAILMMGGGCIYLGGNDSGRVAHKRVVEAAAPMVGAKILWAQTDHGDIVVHGADTDECRVKAMITARSFTKKEAEAIAAATDISLESVDEQMRVRIKTPELQQPEIVIVSLDLTIPRAIATELRTISGDIEIANMDASMTACTTGSGNIKLYEVAASQMDLETHSGSIEGEVWVENLQGSTHSGRVEISCLSGTTRAKDIQLTTISGSILLMVPQDYSAQVKASTHTGKIHTDLPLTVEGTIHNKSASGSIGNGEGRLNVQTTNGSITLKRQE